MLPNCGSTVNADTVRVVSGPLVGSELKDSSEVMSDVDRTTPWA
jgi:hypothetical protein